MKLFELHNQGGVLCSDLIAIADRCYGLLLHVTPVFYVGSTFPILFMGMLSMVPSIE